MVDYSENPAKLPLSCPLAIKKNEEAISTPFLSVFFAVILPAFLCRQCTEKGGGSSYFFSHLWHPCYPLAIPDFPSYHQGWTPSEYSLLVKTSSLCLWLYIYIYLYIYMYTHLSIYRYTSLIVLHLGTYRNSIFFASVLSGCPLVPHYNDFHRATGRSVLQCMGKVHV